MLRSAVNGATGNNWRRWKRDSLITPRLNCSRYRSDRPSSNCYVHKRSEIFGLCNPWKQYEDCVFPGINAGCWTEQQGIRRVDGQLKA